MIQLIRQSRVHLNSYKTVINISFKLAKVTHVVSQKTRSLATVNKKGAKAVKTYVQEDVVGGPSMLALYYKFTLESDGIKILKSNQHLEKCIQVPF